MDSSYLPSCTPALLYRLLAKFSIKRKIWILKIFLLVLITQIQNNRQKKNNIVYHDSCVKTYLGHFFASSKEIFVNKLQKRK